jgi:hypothetical protein
MPQLTGPTGDGAIGPRDAGSTSSAQGPECEAQQMVFQHGIGWMSLATVPIGLAGLAAAALGAHWWLTGKWPPGGALGLLAVGLLIFLLCLAGTFWRLRKVIDRGRRRVIDSWWVLGMSGAREHRLDDFLAVGLVHTTITSDGGSYDRYKVYLAGRRDGRPFLVYLTEYSDPTRADEKAREVAKFTGLRVVRSGD